MEMRKNLIKSTNYSSKRNILFFYLFLVLNCKTIEVMEEISHIKEIVVTEDFLDQNNHVNNVQYVHWVEEIATEHWELVKDKTDYPKEYWVLYDHHIKYRKQVFLGDVLTIKTFPLSPEGLRQPRKVEFYCNGELVVDSDTLWILFDHDSKKVKRIDANWLERLRKLL